MDQLYRENAKIVHHYLLSLCHDQDLAEDLTQETFLQAYKSLDRYDRSCRLSTWLCQIAKHLYYQHLAKNKREIPMVMEEQHPGAGRNAPGDTPTPTGRGALAGKHAPEKSQPENAVLCRLELMDVLKEMQNLPGQMREVVYLRIMADLSFREIGEILGRSENWARVNFYRAKETLLKAKREGAETKLK